MNTAKSYKIILLLTAMIMSVVGAFSIMSFTSAKAEASITPDAYFNYASSTTSEFKNDNAVFTLTKGDTIEIENSIVAEDFLMNYVAGEGIESVKVSIITDSYYVNGNKNAEGKYDKTITNAVTVNADGSADLNGKDLTAGTMGSVHMQVDGNGYFKASIDGANYVTENDAYYRVERSNKYQRLIGKVKIEVALKDGVETASLEIVSLSQKASDSAYLQTFKFTDDKLTEVAPLVSLTKNFKVKDDKVVIYNVMTSITYNVYSFLDGNTRESTKIVASAWVNESNNGSVHFDAGNGSLKIVSKADETVEFATIDLNVLDETAKETRKEGPKYIFEQGAYDAFVAALRQEYVADDKGTADLTDDIYVSIGTAINIPSLKDLVSDDYTVYDELTAELHYAAPNHTSINSSSSTKITLSDAGDYVFFVIFKDADGNSIDEDKFILDKDDNQTEINTAVDAYGQYVFTLHIEDNAPITITPATRQGIGYKGAKYTASKFTVDATGCTISYKLYYNATENATKESEGWIEIPAASTLTDLDYNENGYNYDRVQKIAYDGKLTFTPDVIGSYMIECIANSNTTAREAVAESVINIKNEPKVVKPASDWLQNNVWSVVFLSIGTLCLIGIIVLLCIKPKDKKEN